jgi:hypothetical protein
MKRAYPSWKISSSRCPDKPKNKESNYVQEDRRITGREG